MELALPLELESDIQPGARALAVCKPQLPFRGWAIECREGAEDVEVGRITAGVKILRGGQIHLTKGTFSKKEEFQFPAVYPGEPLAIELFNVSDHPVRPRFVVHGRALL